MKFIELLNTFLCFRLLKAKKLGISCVSTLSVLFLLPEARTVLISGRQHLFHSTYMVGNSSPVTCCHMLDYFLNTCARRREVNIIGDKETERPP